MGPKDILILAVLTWAFLLASPTICRAGEFEDFAGAKNAYEGGEYQTAVERFEALLATEPKNKGLLEEIHKLLAVSYLFVGDKDKAENQFVQLLTMEPSFSLDPMAFPIDVVDFFTGVKNRHAAHLAALAKARADEEAARRKAEEERRKRELETMKRNVYLGRNVERSSKLVAVIPFGAGQFQNRQRTKGIIFLSAELLLTASAITTYILHSSLRESAKEPFESTSERERYERWETGYRIANRVSFAALAAVVIVGIIDSLYFFEEERITWEPLKEGDVPKDLRPKTVSLSLGAIVDGRTFGIGATGTF